MLTTPSSASPVTRAAAALRDRPSHQCDRGGAERHHIRLRSGKTIHSITDALNTPRLSSMTLWPGHADGLPSSLNETMFTTP